MFFIKLKGEIMGAQKRKIVLVTMMTLLLLTSFAIAAKANWERWYGVYHEGEKVGSRQAEYLDQEKDGKTFTLFQSKLQMKLAGSAGIYGANVKREVNWSIRVKHDVQAHLKNGKVLYLKAKRSAKRGPNLKALSKREGNVLVLARKDGAVDQIVKIKPGDYDLTSDPMHLEPFLQTLTTEPVEKKVFWLGDAEIKKTTLKRLGDDTEKDVDGKDKPCQKYKATTKTHLVIYRTIEGRIVKTYLKDIVDGGAITIRWMEEKKAKSDTGY